MVAAIRNFNEEQEEEKNARPNKSGRGERTSERENNINSGNSDSRISKNPNSSNYKGDGDAPKCSKCSLQSDGSKKRHWPFEGYLSALKTSLRRTSLVAMTVQTTLWITTILIFRLWQIWLPVKRISWKMWSIGACRPLIPYQSLVAPRCARSAQAIYFSNLRS